MKTNTTKNSKKRAALPLRTTTTNEALAHLLLNLLLGSCRACRLADLRSAALLGCCGYSNSERGGDCAYSSYRFLVYFFITLPISIYPLQLSQPVSALSPQLLAAAADPSQLQCKIQFRYTYTGAESKNGVGFPVCSLLPVIQRTRAQLKI